MGNINIYIDKQYTYRIYLNEIDASSFISYQKKNDLWKRAIDQLEKDIAEVAERMKNRKFGEFVWCFTWESHRIDGFIGTPYFYFMIEVICYLISLRNVKKIILQRVIPKELYHAMKNMLPVPVEYSVFSPFDKLKVLYDKHIKSYKNLGSFVFRSIKFKVQNKGKIDNIYFVQLRNDSDIRRYLSVLKNVQSEKIYHFNKFIFRPPNVNNMHYKEFDFAMFFNFKIFLKTIIIVSKIKFLIRNECRANGHTLNANLFYRLVSSQTAIQFFKIVTRALLFDEAFKSINVKALYLVSSLSSTHSRLPATIAYRNNIKVVIVASRAMLSNDRPEDRCSSFDINGYNQTYIGDIFFVRDHFSKKTLIEQGIKRGSINVINDTKIINGDKKPAVELNEGIILLLSQYRCNNAIFELIASINLRGFKNIYLRSHPLKKKINAVSDIQLKILRRVGFDIYDITDIPMEDISCFDCVAMTANSTSGVDIVKVGAGVIWLPFITDQSLLFVQVMVCLGKMCASEGEFKRFFSKLNNNTKKRKEFINQCLLQYKIHFQEEALLAS
jgi:hypothetical protein